jgi:hypothetical protein
MSKAYLPVYGHSSHPSTSTTRRLIANRNNRAKSLSQKKAAALAALERSPSAAQCGDIKCRAAWWPPQQGAWTFAVNPQGPESELVVEAHSGNVRGKVGRCGEWAGCYAEGIADGSTPWSASY